MGERSFSGGMVLMKTRQHNDQLRVLIREIPPEGKQLDIELEDGDLTEMIASLADVYLPVGGGLTAAIRLTRQGENVFVHGRIQAGLASVCRRCLTVNPAPLDMAIHWTILPVGAERAEDKNITEKELTIEDLDVSFHDGVTIDLGQIIQEAVLLELSPYPTCPGDGCDLTVLNAATPDPGTLASQPDQPIDPRWMPLASLASRRKANPTRRRRR
ncbi:MAG: DUF177 domain-containing protein [Bradymonadales bacterium]|nr:DUF177 domain-containing protein [Bradymonadales bacterium]